MKRTHNTPYNYRLNKHKNNDESEEEIFELPLPDFSKILGGGLFNPLPKFDHGDDKGKENHLYFYDDVSKESALKLCKKLRATELKLLEMSLKLDMDAPKIYLHINSFGGCIFSAFSIIDTILQSKIPVVTILEGSSASAATLISVAGHERWMSEYAYFLMHQLRGGNWGKMNEIDDDYDNLQEMTRRIKEHYVRFSRGTMTDKCLDEILLHDIWWTAKDCFENGLIDKIITGNIDMIGNCINTTKKVKDTNPAQKRLRRK